MTINLKYASRELYVGCMGRVLYDFIDWWIKWNKMNYYVHIYGQLDARPQYLQCISTGDTAILHWA